VNLKMRLLILTPTALPSITGNAVTTERWRRSLQNKGVHVEVLATQGIEASDLFVKLQRFEPHLIHVHHAFRAGSLLFDPQVCSMIDRLPMVVSPGGTDINLDFEMNNRQEAVINVYRTARIIVAQSRETVKRLEALFPGLQKRIALVPKAFCWLGNDRFDLRKITGFGPEDLLFFLPAGIRPVKGNLECLTAFEKVHAARPWAKIVFAGPDIDGEYSSRFRKELKRHPSFACRIPSIPPESMRSAYQTSDIVLNTSFSEGLSNALLEAIAVGSPVLASHIPGNWWPVLGENGDQPAGVLFRAEDPEDFIHNAIKLIDDEGLRESLGRAGRERALRWPTPEIEADGLIELYKKAIGAC